MSDHPTSQPIRENADGLGTIPDRPLLIRLREALPIAWKHDELFRYAPILGILARLVILPRIGGGTPRYR